MPDIEWVSTCDYRPFTQSFNEMTAQVRQTKAAIEAMGTDASAVLEKMNSMSGSLVSTLRQVGAVAGVSFSVAQATSFVKQVVAMREHFQDIESSMKVFLGSAEKGAEFTAKLKDYAYYNMFEFKDLASASQQMIAYGHDVETIIPRLDQLSNVAVGTHGNLMELVASYNKAKSTGFLDAQSVASWATKGVVIKDVLKEMGVQANSSRISFEQLNMVLDHVTGEGGMFHDLQLSMMENISAEVGQFEDNFNAMLNQIGENWQDEIVKVIKAGSWLIDNYQDVAKALFSLIGSYGAYKAALVATRTIEKSYQGIGEKERTNEINAQIEEEKKKLLELKQARGELTDEDLKAAVAKGKLTEARAKELEQMRAELSMKVGSGELSSEGASKISEKQKELAMIQTVKEANANAIRAQIEDNNKEMSSFRENIRKKEDDLKELEAIRKEYNKAFLDKDWETDAQSYSSKEYKDLEAANKEYEKAEKAMEAYREKALESVDALREQNSELNNQLSIIEGNTSSKEGNTVAEEANTIAENANTIATSTDTKATTTNTVSEQTNTAATQGNTAATQGNTLVQKGHAIALKASTTASRIWTVAVEQMKTAVNGLKAAIMTNPLGLFLGAVTMALPWIMEWISGSDEAGSKTKEFENAADEAASKVNSLHAILETVSEDSKVYKDSVKELSKVYEEYGIKLDETIMTGDKESAKVDEMKKHHEELVDVLRLEAIEREKANNISANNKEYGEKSDKIRSNVVDDFSDDFNEAEKNALAFSVISQADIDMVVAKYEEYAEKIQEANKKGLRYTSESINAWNAYQQAIKDVNEKVDIFTARTDASDVAKHKAREATERMTNALAMNKYEQNELNREVEEAAEKAAAAQEGYDKHSEATLDAKKSVTQLRNELETLVKQYGYTDLNIKIHYQEENIPAWMKGFNEKDAHKNAAWWKRQADKLGKAGESEKAKAAMIRSAQYTAQETAQKNKREAKEERAAFSQNIKDAKSRDDYKGLLSTATTNLNKAVIGSEAESYWKQAVKQLQKKNKDLSVKTSNKKDHTAENNAKERQKLFNQQMADAERIAKEEKALEDALTDARIANIENDGERERQARAEQHERRLREIREQENKFKQEAYKRAEAEWNAKNRDKKTVFSDTKEGQAGWQAQKLDDTQKGIIAAQLEKENAEYQRYIEERYDAERKAVREFLQEYGTLEQQKLAITEDYEDKIAKASTVAEKAGLSIQRDKALKELEAKDIKESIDWAGVFNDLSGHTEEYLTGLREQLQQLLSTGNLPIDQMETIQGKIREINEAINEQGGMFSFANEQQREHTRRVEEARDAQERLNKALDEQRMIEADVNLATSEIRKELEAVSPALKDVDLSGEWLDSLGLDKTSEEYKRLEKLAIRLRKAEGQLGEARENTSKRLYEWKKAEDGVNEGFKDMVARVAGNIKDWVNTYLGDLPDLLNEIGLGGVGEKVSQGISAVNNAAGAAADFASGNYVGAALKAVSAVKDFGRVLGIGGGNAAEINKQLARLSERNEILTQSIDKLTDAMNGKGGAGAINEYMKVAEMQKELEENLLKQMQLQMQYHSSHSSFNKYWGSGFSASEIDAFNKRYGTNWSGNLNDLTADLAALLMGEADMWQKINDTGKGGYGERVAEKIAELAEQAGKAKEQTDALYASLTAGTTRENVFDDFLNSLYDLADGSEDVFENIEKNWQQMVNHMVINNLIGEKLRERLSEWYDQLAELNKERTKEGSTMSDAEYKRRLGELQSLYQSYVQEGADQIEQFRDMGIIKSVQDAAEDAAEETKGYLDSIRSAFEELISGTETDLNKWAANIRNIIISNLVQSTLMGDEFETWMEEWSERYSNLLQGGWSTSGRGMSKEQYDAIKKGLDDELDDMTKSMSEKSKAMLEAFGYTFESEDAKSVFDDLHSSFLSTLTDMNADVEAWSRNITKTMVEQLVERNILNDAFDGQMDEWRARFESALQAGDTDGLKALRTELEDLRESLAEQAKGYMEAMGYVNDVLDTTFKGMSGDFKSSLMNLDGTAEDWAKTVGQKMAEMIIDEMVTASMLQPFLDNLQDAFNAAMSVDGATIDGVLAQIAPQIDAAKQAFDEAQPTVQKILAALGITKKVETPFGDLRSTFLSTLTDMESDAETFGKEIGKTLISQMIDAQLKQQFQDKLDDLNSAWAVALQNGDTTAIATIRQQMVELREDAAQAVKPLLDDLKTLEDIENPFADLRSSFLSSLQDLESDTKKFGTQMTENLVGQMMDEILSKNGLQEKIDELGVEWRKALDAGDTTAIDGIIAKMGALRDESAKAVEPLIEKLKSLDEVVLDTPLNNLRSSFLSDLMSMEDGTEDFADNINKILTEAFVDKFVLGKAFDEQLELWEKRYADIMEADISEADRAKQLQDLQQSIGVAREHYTEQARAIQELMGYTNTEALADQEAHVNMADKATYDQFELYLGIATAQQIALEQGNDVRKQILSTLQTMSGITSPNGDTVKEIRSMLRTTNEHLYAIKTATEGIRAEFMPRLQSIDNKLSKL